MNRHVLWGLGLLSLWLHSAAWGQAGAPSAPPSSAFMWTAAKDGRKIYLMGTIHAGRTNSLSFTPAVTRCLEAAEAIAVEADVSDAETLKKLVRQIALYPSAEPGLDARLSPAQKQRLTKFLGKTEDSLWRSKPWFLANLVLQITLMQWGYSPTYGTEALLLAFAKSHDKKIIEVEGLERQLKLFDSPPAETQIAYLEEVIRSVDSGEAEREAKALFAAYENNDAVAIRRFYDEMMQANTPVERYFEKLLFDDRHPGMLAMIEALVATGKTHVFAVGTLHFFGPKGLLALLETRGFTIQPIPAVP